MTTRGRPSVFVALNKLRVTEDFDSDDNSAEERQEERKEKQKLKKKARTKKKNSSTQLKDLAFVSVSKPKKNKSKKSKTQSQSSAAVPSEETPTVNGDGDDRQEAESLANVIKATPQPQKTPVAVNDSDTKPQSVIRHETVAQPQKQQQQQKKKAASTPNEPQQQTAAPPPASIASPPALSFPQSSSETELGAIYTPAHITITRVDGQIKRTVAVTEVMDQLLRYTQQNSQLLTLQEQLGHANRSLQDQLQRSAEIITSLQNEVTMFRQMCLNLQAEVSLLRSNVIPDVGSPLQLQHRPPPGMS